MARAEIYIEDDDEKVAVRFMFAEIFDPKSGAHQLCNMLRQWCDVNMMTDPPPGGAAGSKADESDCAPPG